MSAASDSARAGIDRLAGWLVRRSLAPDSLAGISVLLALCAAAWFSGGSTADSVRGILPLAGCLIAIRGARLLANLAGRPMPAAGVPPGSTDWLVRYPAAATGRQAAVRPPAGRDGAVTARSDRRRTLLAICEMTCEFTVYGGIAMGGGVAGWPQMWQEAIAAVIVIAVRETVGLCRGQARSAAAGSADAASRPVAGRAGPTVLRACWLPVRAALGIGSGGRIALTAAALLFDGPRVALFAVLAWSVVAAAADMTRRAAPVAAGSSRPAADSCPAILVAMRDDGALGRWAGRLVHGNLTPLPGAVAGLAATALLASLGMGDTIGIVKLAPPVVMLLAAPGSSHPHQGRRDWLVPAVMQLGQYVYLAALGLSSGVPRPVIFVLCALTAVRYRYLAARSGRPGRSSLVGWEGRLCCAGVGAMFGIATVAYLAIAAYLGVLVCRAIVTCLRPEEVTRR